MKPIEPINNDLRCMLLHLENENYRISLIVPGVLPEEEGGKPSAGYGAIIFQVEAKVGDSHENA